MATLVPEPYGPNLSQFQREYYDRYNAAVQTLQTQQVRLVSSDVDRIVKAVLDRLSHLIDREKLAEELAPIC